MNTDIEKLGVVGQVIVDKFNLSISPDTPVYVGLHNRIHMENRHEEIYSKYADCLGDIIQSPDYVGVHPNDSSLEYYKNFGDTVIHVKLAVRPTKNGVYFARTVYEINEVSLNSYIRKGRVKAV